MTAEGIVQWKSSPSRLCVCRHNPMGGFHGPQNVNDVTRQSASCWMAPKTLSEMISGIFNIQSSSNDAPGRDTLKAHPPHKGWARQSKQNRYISVDKPQTDIRQGEECCESFFYSSRFIGLWVCDEWWWSLWNAPQLVGQQETIRKYRVSNMPLLDIFIEHWH